MKKMAFIFYMTTWTCCIMSITIRPYSDMWANILFAIEMLCFAIYIIIHIVKIIINNRKIKKLKREIALMILHKDKKGE